jgi:steroid delta-isomerase-like uncharacterized protein
MSARQNKELALNWFRLLDAHDLTQAEDLFAPDYVLTLSGQEHRGAQGIIGVVSSFYEAFPDLRFTTGEVVADDDYVLVRWRARGTQQGPLQGLPPTGRMASWTGMSLFRFRDGRIVDDAVEMDAAGMMQQLLPAAAPAAV